MNAQRTWVRVTQSRNIPLREGRAVRIGKREIALFNLGNDRFLAVENRCPHQGGPLSDAILSGNSVVCPLHAWKIDLESGVVERPSNTSQCVTTFATCVEDGVVLVQIPTTRVDLTCTQVEVVALSTSEHPRFDHGEFST